MIGRAYGWASDLDGEHGVKQVDRLLSNENVPPWALAKQWIAMLVGPREEVLVALDWTDFGKDDHTQRLHWYMAIPRTRQARLHLLINAYGEVLKEHQLTRDCSE